MANLCPACAVAKFISELREAGGLRNALLRQATRAVERAAASVEKAARTASERGPVVLESALTCAGGVALRSSASVDLGGGRRARDAGDAAASKDTPVFSLRIQVARRPSATGGGE
jgi:hypothetical protein